MQVQLACVAQQAEVAGRHSAGVPPAKANGSFFFTGKLEKNNNINWNQSFLLLDIKTRNFYCSEI